MTTYSVHQVREEGPGRCHKCMAQIKRLMYGNELVLGEWNGKAWVQHECEAKK